MGGMVAWRVGTSKRERGCRTVSAAASRVHSVDRNLRRLLAHLETLGLADKTVSLHERSRLQQ